ncbi:MAG: hypothetical protein HYT40_02155, partial [Candidatus Sungbacteria bacterium]|nr:hypothetical protein [Candidatus Sungbacteria bacterium]
MVRQVVRKAMKLIARKKRRRQLDRILKIRPVLRPFRELCRRCREAELRWRKDPANILLREEAQQWRATVWHYFERQEENYQPELA